MSNFARFADLLKDSMSTKRGPTPTMSGRRFSAQHDVVDDHDVHQHHVLPNRRSSSSKYTEKMLHMFSSTLNHRPKAASQSFNKLPVEILHHVFLGLDLCTLLRIRRVCKLWKDMIPGDSPLLAEDLFLKPSYNFYAYSFTVATFDFDFEISVRAPATSGGPLSPLSPLSLPLLPPPPPPPPPPHHVRVNPTYMDGLGLTRRCMGLIRMSGEFVFHPVIMHFNHYVQGDEAGISKLVMSADDDHQLSVTSWQNMLVSMPPITELRINRTLGHKTKTMCVLKSPSGVRLGDVFETLGKWGRKELFELD
ncbi:hypothetical protein ACEQ8H_005551 [Pleosporales sp. CAS-2024a]